MTFSADACREAIRAYAEDEEAVFEKGLRVLYDSVGEPDTLAAGSVAFAPVRAKEPGRSPREASSGADLPLLPRPSSGALPWS